MQTKAPASPVILQNVQFLRAVAALSCVFAHLQVFVTSAFGLKNDIGGVDLFFVISGFIIGYTTTNVNLPPRKFVARRIVRIVPLYWVTTIGVFLLATAGVIGRVSTDFNALLQSLFFIPYLSDNGLIQPTWFVGWTLNYEMFFYALAALALLVRNDLVRTIGLMVALTAIVVWGYFAKTDNVILVFLADPYLLDFVLGLGLFLLTQRLPAAAPTGGRSVAMLASVVGLVACMAGPAIYPGTHTAITCGAPSVLLIGGVVALERWGWQIKSPSLILLGNASYSIYLLHPFVTQGLEKIAKRMTLDVPTSLAFIATGLVFSTLLGIVGFHLIEKPLGGYAKRIRLPGGPLPKPAPRRRLPA